MNVFATEHPAIVCLLDSGQIARAASNGYFPRRHHIPAYVVTLVHAAEPSYPCGGDVCESAAELPGAAPALARSCADSGVMFLASHDPRAVERVATTGGS